MVQLVEVEEQVQEVDNYYNSETDILPFRKDLTEHYLENGRGSRTPEGFIDFDAVVAIQSSKHRPI